MTSMATDKTQTSGNSNPEVDNAGRQVSVSVLASMIGMALRYVAALLTTQALGIRLFGSYVQAQTITQLLSMAGTLGLSPGVVPFVARARLNADEPGMRAIVRSTWAITIAASGLLALALFVLAPWLARAAFRDPAIAPMLRWLAPTVAFAAVMLASLAIAQGFKALRAQAIIEKIVTVSATLAGLIVTWQLDLGVTGVLVATLLGPTTGLLCSLGYVRARVPGALQAHAPSSAWPVRDLLQTCWPLLGTGLVAFALSSVNILLLGVLSEPAQAGYYGASVRMLPVVFVVHQNAAQLFYAYASERFVDRDMQEIDAIYKRTARWSIWSAIGAALLLVIWGGDILGLFGPDFAAGAPVLSVLVIGQVITAMTGSCGKAMIAMGRIRQNMINVITMLCLNVVLCLLLIPQHGALGAACAATAARGAVRIALAAQVWWTFRIHPWSKDSLIALISGGLVYVIAGRFREGGGGEFGWTVALAACATAWLALSLIFGLGPRDRASLRHLLVRRR